MNKLAIILMATMTAIILNDQAFAQCLPVDFSIPSQGCLNEKLLIADFNASENFFEWDFCGEDLMQTPTGAVLFIYLNWDGVTGLKLVHSTTQGWVGFVVSGTNNKLFRIDYGTDLDNPTPPTTDLGNLGSLFNRPESIDIIQEGSNWIGLIVNFNQASVVRLEFGTSLLNQAPVASAIPISPALNVTLGSSIKIITEGTNHFAFFVNRGSSKIIRMNFGSSLVNNPIVDQLTPPGAASPRGLSFVKACDGWHGWFVSTTGNLLHRMDLTTPDAPPVFTTLTKSGDELTGAATIEAEIDYGNYYLVISSSTGAVFRVNLGTSPTNNSATITNLSNLTLFPNFTAFDLLEINGEFFGYLVGNNKFVYKILFKSDCPAEVQFLSNEQRSTIKYTGSGSFGVELKAYQSEGQISYKTSLVTILNSQAPDIIFTSQNNCVNHAINFEAQNVSGNLISYEWNFGDSNTSTQSNPSHIFVSATDYLVQLGVLATNGCRNVYQNEVTIINQPLVDFSIPAVSPMCTNQPYTFANLTSYDSRIPPVWKWQVNGIVVSEDQQLLHTFTNSSSQEIRLKASIPGCESIVTKNIPAVTEGPLVNFSSSGQCQDSPVSFTNETTGSVNGYSWDFGDGQNSTDEDPINSYSSPGTFNVTLTAVGSSGCNNTKTESVTIYSKPQTDFSVALPPFSCSGTPTQFTDTTPNPFDSNLASWQWNFGDGTGSSTTRNPQYTFQNAGDYSVSFTAITNFGCSSTIQKPVTISPSPVASFTNSPPCLGVPVNFTNTSTGSLQSQQWQIQSSFYTVVNPVHAFLTSGDKNVTLNVTATNGCISSVTRTLNVPIVLTPDFSVSRNCINQQTEFTDITNDAADPVVGYNWNFAGLGNGTENPQVFSFANTGNFNVSLSVTTQTGCVHSTAKNVSIINSPQANFIATPSFGPPPLQVQFTNTSTNAASYLWEFNDPNTSSSTSVSPSFTFSELGSYAVDLTAFNAQGCSSIFSRLIEVVIPFTDVALTQLELIETGQASVKPAVTIQNKGNIAITNLPLTFEVDGTAFRTFVAASIPPNSSYYHLSDFELPVPSSLSYVCALAEIEDTSPDDNQLCASVDQPILVLAPYPNPATAQSHIDVQWIVRENRVVEVFMINSLGQTVYSERVNSVSGLNTFRLPGTGFQTGLYFLQVRSGDFSSTHRLMVQ